MNSRWPAQLISATEKWLLPATALIYLFAGFFPWVAARPPSSPDDSWQMVLHVAHQQHLQFGRDIIFTFGPYGFLYQGYDPTTYATSVIAWSFVSFAFWWSGWRLAQHFADNPWGAWCWLIAFAGIASIRVEQIFDVRMTGLALLLLWLHFFVENSPVSRRQIMLAIAAGMLALVKFTSFMEFSAVILLITIADVMQRRRVPGLAIAFAASLLFFWLAARQSLAGIFSFLKYSWILAGGLSNSIGGQAHAPSSLSFR